MCGRYLLRNAPEHVDMTWREYYERIEIQFSRPRYNICPSQSGLVLREQNATVVCDALPWGFKPRWSKYQPSINARAEGLLGSKMFKPSALKKRCLVIADGFYEPKGPKTNKNRPWHVFEYNDQRLFAMAGIYLDDGFAIITQAANDEVKDIHDRMPHILAPQHWPRWLDAGFQDEAGIQALLNPGPYPGLVHYPVSDHVKKPGNEGPECIQPLQDLFDE